MADASCPRCGREFKDGRGLAGHRQHSHCWKEERSAGSSAGEKLEVVVPELDRHRYVPKQVEAALARIERLSSTQPDLPVNVKLVGPAGCGKSSLAEYFAARHDRPFHDVNCGTWLDALDAVGQLHLAGNRSVFRLASWLDFIESVPGCVVLLDELNRPETVKSLNALYSILDHRGSIWVQQIGRRVVRAPGTVIFAAINRDPGDAGLEALGDPMRDRWHHLMCDYPTPAKEARVLGSKTGVTKKKAAAIVGMANALRKAKPAPVSVSVRQTLQLAQLAALDESARLRELAAGSIAHAFDEDYSQSIAQLVLQAASTFEWGDDGAG